MSKPHQHQCRRCWNSFESFWWRLALCPLIHRCTDEHYIAPGPACGSTRALRWVLSPTWLQNLSTYPGTKNWNVENAMGLQRTVFQNLLLGEWKTTVWKTQDPSTRIHTTAQCWKTNGFFARERDGEVARDGSVWGVSISSVAGCGSSVGTGICRRGLRGQRQHI